MRYPHGEVESSQRRQRTPWHLWAIGSFFVLLNAVGAYDHVLSLTENADYFRSQHYTDAQVRYFTDYPVFPAIFWTIGVWAGLTAAILLLLRTRWALPSAITGLVAQLVLDLLTFGFRDRWQVLGPGMALFDSAILLLTAAFAAYCRTMSTRGILR